MKITNKIFKIELNFTLSYLKIEAIPAVINSAKMLLIRNNATTIKTISAGKKD